MAFGLVSQWTVTKTLGAALALFLLNLSAFANDPTPDQKPDAPFEATDRLLKEASEVARAHGPISGSTEPPAQSHSQGADRQAETWNKIWPESSQKTLEEVFQLHEKLVETWDELRSTVGNDDLFNEEWIRKGKVHVEIKGLGSAELNMLEAKTPLVSFGVDLPHDKVPGVVIARIIHRPTEICFLIFDETELPVDPKHRDQYLARLKIMAGTSRRDGKTGRNVIILRKNVRTPTPASNIKPSDIERHYRHSMRSAKFWVDYWNALKKAPTGQTFTFGSICGLAQGVLAGGVACFKKYLDPEHPLELNSAKLSALWGTGIGTFVSMYRNWTNLGTRMVRTLKSSSNSIAFAYAFTMLSHPRGIEALSIVDPEGLLLHLTVATNALATNLAKVHWTEFSRVRERIGMTRKPLTIKIPGFKRFDTGVSLANADNQAVYLAPFTIRLLDLTGLMIGSFPLGKVVLWGSIPAVEWWAMRYVEKLAQKSMHPAAIEMARTARKNWEWKKALWRNREMRAIYLEGLLAQIKGDENRFLAAQRLLGIRFPEVAEVMKGQHLLRRDPVRDFLMPGEEPPTPGPNKQPPTGCSRGHLNGLLMGLRRAKKSG